MNWKEQLYKDYGFYLRQLNPKAQERIINFISTEIIEKLIEDIPDEAMISERSLGAVVLGKLKQQLRDKWL